LLDGSDIGCILDLIEKVALLDLTAVEKDRAAISKAQASVPSAESNLDRYQRLVGSGATKIEFETAKTTLLQAKAEVESAKAA
ncbi:efflux RND transporter periplasmic adaptor subunit, partial [Rhizobium ruizarguesonis]